MTDNLPRPDWQNRALCRGAPVDLWHPAQGASQVEAKKICFRCPVRADCLEHALIYGETFGVWGGLSGDDRRKLRRQRIKDGTLTPISLHESDGGA